MTNLAKVKIFIILHFQAERIILLSVQFSPAYEVREQSQVGLPFMIVHVPLFWQGFLQKKT